MYCLNLMLCVLVCKILGSFTEPASHVRTHLLLSCLYIYAPSHLKVLLAYNAGVGNDTMPRYTEWCQCPCTLPVPVDAAELYAAVRQCTCRQPTALALRRQAVLIFAAQYTFFDSKGQPQPLSEEQRRAVVFFAALPDCPAEGLPVADEAPGGEHAAGATLVDKRRVALLTGRMSLQLVS